MPITLLTVDTLTTRAETLVKSFASWSASKGSALSSETTNLHLRNLGTHVDAFSLECAAIIAATGYSGLSADLRADIESIQLVMSDVHDAINPVVAVDAAFSALPSPRQAELVSEFGTWADIPDELKRDILQHDLVDSVTVDAIVAAVTIA